VGDSAGCGNQRVSEPQTAAQNQPTSGPPGGVVCLPVARKASGRQIEQKNHRKNANCEPTAEIPNTGLYNSAFFRGSLSFSNGFPGYMPIYLQLPAKIFACTSIPKMLAGTGIGPCRKSKATRWQDGSPTRKTILLGELQLIAQHLLEFLQLIANTHAYRNVYG
jgi:hypothetical protein